MNTTGRVTLVLAAAVLMAAGCATYAERTDQVNKHFISGRLEQAYSALQSNKTSLEPRNSLLHHLNLGTLSHHLENYEQSNAEFEVAYDLAEETRLNIGEIVLAQMTNPEVAQYRGEDFEFVLLHYYKVLNFLSMNDIDGALVEVRRINIRLAEINSGYGQHSNRYAVDAFALNVSGMLYEALGEYNDAFIAYRNAYEAYVQVYAPLFDIAPPEQLKLDVIRTAALSGLTDERLYYESLFNLEYEPDPPEYGSVIVLWHSGLGPVKAESSINLVVVEGAGGGLAFVNRDLGISVPFAAASSGQKG
ncbi:MAG: hypothetical protein E4H09_02950, partial [Spirochaetales bacterium]